MLETTHGRTVTAALDVHKDSIRLCALRGDEIVDERTLGHEHDAVIAALKGCGAVRACYEAGPTGYGLARRLRSEGFDCEVIAPGLVPTASGDRVKTDSRDARKLARLHAADLLISVDVPEPGIEAARDLVRAREDARLDRMRARHRLSKFCLRNDLRMPTTCWGPTRRRWLGSRSFEDPARQAAFDDYVQTVDIIDARIARLDGAVAELAEAEPLRELVAKLRCLRGVDTLTAVGICAEIGDFSRFDSAPKFMAFTGLVASEHSSGQTRKQGSITKAGNTHLRRLLVEAAWHARRRPKVSYELSRRQRGADPALPAPTLFPLVADGRARQAAAEDRRRYRPRAERVHLGNRHRPTTRRRRLNCGSWKSLETEQRITPTSRRTLG